MEFLKYIAAFFQPPPNEGDHITMTWLSPARNAPGERNAYIGMSGIVSDLDKDGCFWLKGETSWLLVSRKYIYKRTPPKN